MQILIVFWYIISKYNFVKSLKIILINMATILMSAKLTTPGLLKINIFQNKVMTS